MQLQSTLETPTQIEDGGHENKSVGFVENIENELWRVRGPNSTVFKKAIYYLYGHGSNTQKRQSGSKVEISSMIDILQGIVGRIVGVQIISSRATDTIVGPSSGYE